MALDAHTATTLGRTIAAEIDSSLRIVGVAATHGGSDRVELLVDVVGQGRQPRLRMLNLTRATTRDFEQDLRRLFRETLKQVSAEPVTRNES